MSDIKIERTHGGWDQDRGGWLYYFNVTYSGQHFAVPVLIADECPENDREHYANVNFRDWLTKLEVEASRL